MSSNDAGMAYSAIEVEVEGDQTAVNNEVPDNIAKALPGTNSKDTPPPFFFKSWIQCSFHVKFIHAVLAFKLVIYLLQIESLDFSIQ